MAWVKTFDENEATGRLAEVYQEVMEHPLNTQGMVDNAFRCMGLRPEALRSVWHLSAGVSFGASTLGRAREDMLATAVSAKNSCPY